MVKSSYCLNMKYTVHTCYENREPVMVILKLCLLHDMPKRRLTFNMCASETGDAYTTDLIIPCIQYFYDIK